jgi:hypothetical protein
MRQGGKMETLSELALSLPSLDGGEVVFLLDSEGVRPE